MGAGICSVQICGSPPVQLVVDPGDTSKLTVTL
jgi:hypothetical protein